MNNLKIKNVEFLGDTLVAAQDEDGKIWAAVKWVCDGIGLTEGQTKSEKKRVQEDAVLKQGGRNFILPTQGGNQEVLCLQLDFIPLWLAKITITPTMKVNNPRLVEKLIDYQLKAKDALAAAFLPSCNTIYQYPLTPATFEATANLSRIIERIMKLQGSQAHEIATVIKSVCQQAGIELLDCFVKVPAYEQLSFMPDSYNDIITRV